MEEKLKKYCTVISGYAFKSQDLSEGIDIPIIKIGNISNGENIIVDNSTQYVNKEFLSIDKKYHVLKGDILISLTGSHMNQPNSMVGRCCKNLDNVVYLLNQRAGKVIPKKTVNKDFLYYVFRLKSIQYAIANRAYGGANQVNVSPKDIMGIKFTIPNFTVQNRIVDILSAYDNLIENNNKRIKLLEQMAENLYKEWFVRFRFPGYKNVEFEEKKPRGWQVGTDDKKHFVPTIFKYDELRNIGSFIRGKNITTAKMIEGDIPVVSAGLQPSGYHNEANVYGASLTISASGANAGYLQYHMKDIWAADCSYYQDDATIWFVYNTLKYLQPVISNLQCGAAQPHVYPKNTNRICILIPPEELIHKYNDYVKPYYDEIKILNQQNQLLTKQRDMLLPRLMSGKLEM